MALLLPVEASAQSLRLSDLRGFSIDATIHRIEEHRNLNVGNSPFVTEETTFHEQIYVSNQLRLFERQGFENQFSKGQWDSVTIENDQHLRFEPSFGFRRFNYDGGGKDKSTYVMITTFPIRRDGSTFRCEASVDYLLGSGQKQYIKHVSNGDVLYIKPGSWHVTASKCSISKVNIFE